MSIRRCILNVHERRRIISTLPEEDRPTDQLMANFLSTEMKVPDAWRVFEKDLPLFPPSGTRVLRQTDWIDVPITAENRDAQREIRRRGAIVLLLESPHKDEYDYIAKRELPFPRAPAQGESGVRIRALADGTNGRRLNEHPLVLVNPVQWQTSLHFFFETNDWQEIRDLVWEELWMKRRVQDSLVSRINALNPLLVVNACTDDSRGGRRGKVQDLLMSGKIKNRSSVNRDYVVGHPSSWRGKSPIQSTRIHEFLDIVLHSSL